MLRECGEHGFFRGETCPFCGKEERFLMNEDELSWFGRTLTGILRHFPEKFEVGMDENGWVDINQIVENVKAKNPRTRWLKPEHVIGIVRTDEKGRYQIRMGKVRATYGHSLEVTLDLPSENIPKSLFYPSNPDEAEILLDAGIRHSDRAMVHLSDTMISAREAGSHRAKEPVIFMVDTAGATDAGVVIRKAGHHVYVADYIPPEFISIASE